MRREVYWNLHQGMWSVRDTKTGRVAMRVPHVLVETANFAVQPAGRRKVLKEQRKNVHAFVRGNYFSSSRAYVAQGIPASYLRHAKLHEGGASVRVTYNPYRADHFMEVETGLRVTIAEWVLLTHVDGRPVVWAWVNEKSRRCALRDHKYHLETAHSVVPQDDAGQNRQCQLWRQLVATVKAIQTLEEIT